MLVARALLLAALAANAPTAPLARIVHLRGAHPLESSDRSCGAARRLLDDTYLVHLWPDGATINRTPWSVLFAWDTGAILEHASESDSVTREVMLLEFGDVGRQARAELTLFGITEAREPCADRVRLVGPRER